MANVDPHPVNDAKGIALQFVARWPDRFRADFSAWLSANWAIWLAFRAQADRVYASGRRHYSARTIVEWLRHETALRESGVTFKLDGNMVPDMARLYLCFHPERAGFFELRRPDGSQQRAA